jgi:hypothetical protein
MATATATSIPTPVSTGNIGGGTGRPTTPPSQTVQQPDPNLQAQFSPGQHSTTPPPSSPGGNDHTDPETAPTRTSKIWGQLRSLGSTSNRIATAIGGLFAIAVSIYTILNFIGQNQKHVNALADWEAMKDYSEHCVAMAEAKQVLSENCRAAVKPNFLPPPPTDRTAHWMGNVTLAQTITGPGRSGVVSRDYIPPCLAFFDIVVLSLAKRFYCARHTDFAGFPLISIVMDYGFTPYIRLFFEMTNDDRRHILTRGPSPSPKGLLTSLLALSMAPLLFFCWYGLLILLPVSAVMCLEYVGVDVAQLGTYGVISFIITIYGCFGWISFKTVRSMLGYQSIPLRLTATSRTNTGEMLRYYDGIGDKRD